MNQLQAVRDVLRALADVRDGSFYRLYVELPFKEPIPEIGFRIYGIADRPDAFAVVYVSVTRPDCVEVAWSLSLETTDDALIVTGSVELTTDKGTVGVFNNSHTLYDPADVGNKIHILADQVCGERSWITRS